MPPRGPLSPGRRTQPLRGRRVFGLLGPHQVRGYWLPAQLRADSALAMAMGHVESKVDRQVPYLHDYARRFTDLPLLVTLREREGAYVADRFPEN
jgi:nitrate reductase alpha subunit